MRLQVTFERADVSRVEGIDGSLSSWILSGYQHNEKGAVQECIGKGPRHLPRIEEFRHTVWWGSVKVHKL